MSQSAVVIAHDNETIRGVIASLLEHAGFATRAVADGPQCLPLVQKDHVIALVLDVAISGLLPMDLIEVARARTPRIPVVLVASIYNRTSYKRRPTSLYGADDYVEQHHIADALVDKLIALVGAPPPAPGRDATKDPASGTTVRAAADQLLSARPSGVMSEVVRAERLARLIVSDIALYNGDAIVAARERGEGELEARLRIDLEEGRLLFELRVPAAVRRDRDFIEEALRELMTRDKVA